MCPSNKQDWSDEASAIVIASEWRCIVVDRQCRESEGKAKIEGYMSVSDEEAHQWVNILQEVCNHTPSQLHAYPKGSNYCV